MARLQMESTLAVLGQRRRYLAQVSMNHRRTYRNKKSRRGMESIQGVMIMAVAAVVLILLVHYLPIVMARFASGSVPPTQTQTKSQPATTPAPSAPTTPSSNSLLQNALLMGAILGVIGWSGKMILKFASQRGEMVVLHVLSDDVPRE